jgi:hypothetical protein
MQNSIKDRKMNSDVRKYPLIFILKMAIVRKKNKSIKKIV